MNSKTTIILIVLVLICGIAAYGIASGAIEDAIFNSIPYNYSSGVLIPSNEGSLGGYYAINGQGKNFNFNISLPGEENTESPFDYTKDGLNGTGHLNNIGITYNTITSLWSHDLKGAMFNTKFDGTFNMSCAAWTGNGSFLNNGQNFTGNFKIRGVFSYWNGTFDVKEDSNRIKLQMNYVWYPNNNPQKAKNVQEIIYM
ncbi:MULTISPECIES: hypothetical protein [Methanobacterium]|uniref:Uncharacterized protein n=1 Tax=Methanobacterium veterum TaxID=408577 RepID=A0A9E5A477_9EURY|nr:MULTISPECIES: hypothetical protein [Methanobacterium]MCZ3364280.1 hypothetical protein [Methanobacterium veterum]MCZ3372027.1 hypothetical protein [Methanobacterium veterum]